MYIYIIGGLIKAPTPGNNPVSVETSTLGGMQVVTYIFKQAA